jgi:hypothetical protein
MEAANAFCKVVRVRTHQLNENWDDGIESKTELNQPTGLPVLIAN